MDIGRCRFKQQRQQLYMFCVHALLPRQPSPTPAHECCCGDGIERRSTQTARKPGGCKRHKQELSLQIKSPISLEQALAAIPHRLYAGVLRACRLRTESAPHGRHAEPGLVDAHRAWTSCNLWELRVDDVLRMRALQPGMLDDIAEHFVQTASRVLRSMDAIPL